LIFKGWQKTSLIEYPGKISTVLFTGGCNFRCPFCYNTELVERPGELADLSAEMVLQYLSENRALYQAVVVSGGEPTLHSRLPEFFERVKDLGLSTGLETNGTNPAMVSQLLQGAGVDFIGMDVKAPLKWSAYQAAAGLAEDRANLLEKVKRTLCLLKGARVLVELRCTVVPGLHERADILALAEQLEGFPSFILQQFKPDGVLEPRMRKVKPFNPQDLEDLRGRISRLFARCELRGC